MKIKYCQERFMLLYVLNESLRHIKIVQLTKSIWFGYLCLINYVFTLHPNSWIRTTQAEFPS